MSLLRARRRVRPLRATVATAVLALVAAGFVAAPASAAGEVDVLVAQTAILTTHGTGLPAAGTAPGQQLAKVVVDIEVQGVQRGEPSYHVDVMVDLAGTPADNFGPDARIFVEFGHLAGNQCQVGVHRRSEPTSGRDGSRYHIFGYTPDYWAGTPDRPWECVQVAVTSPDATVLHDGMVGALSNSYQAPQIEVGVLELLSSPQTRVELVRGVWTTFDIEIANSGPIESGAFELVGSGKGLRIGKVTVDGIGPESQASARISVKLTGKRPSRLTLRATGSGIGDVTRTWRVKEVKAPARPKDGRYRSKAGDVSFTIRRGKVIGWSGTMQTMCGGYGSLPTYTQNTYDFPATKVPRNGILDDSVRGSAGGSAWSTFLQMKVVGAKVTRGYFRYATAGPCSAVATFTAKRVSG